MNISNIFIEIGLCVIIMEKCHILFSDSCIFIA